MTLREDVEAVIEALLPSTNSDGYRLLIRQLGEDSVVLGLDFDSEACRECVLPEPVLNRIVTTALAERGRSGVAVRVVDDWEA